MEKWQKLQKWSGLRELREWLDSNELWKSVEVQITPDLMLKRLARGRNIGMEKMRKPVIITAPRLTPEETGRLYGLSKRRTKQIIDMVEKSFCASWETARHATDVAHLPGNPKENTRNFEAARS
ncbi:MAG TPA: hypothetical protein VE263_15195 [Candidatus Angelobacter sp.]|nr:hypothetical protein [Candidatus Angelobacter sp.]